ncbi:MAG: peptidylprolyl isomerase [Candidatus Bathyarchaeota archaeon]|nr:peptidylprolyl isomerase [Candidatus Bathyarchaeota archaeon]MDH5532273.1 peptidylprolyl isomerase [Candidatus Bathyarchaeota archaeon]MDH5712931.1 peptidylprolyl isomerase [Candidatus Bathyarchaeota archaeon]
MSIEKGDFILIDYVAKVKETGEIFDTTIEEVAKKERLYKEGEIYESRLMVVGEGWMLKELEESLPNFELKKTASVEIPPEKAFGPRDPEKVRLVPLRRLTTRGITPQPGMRIELDRKFATVRTMGSGRVQLDFNPPLAGKTLIYDVTVQKKLETKLEKITALIHRRIPAVEVGEFNLKISKKGAVINVPEEAFYVDGLQLAKRGIATDIQKFFPETTTVKFVEAFKRKETGREQA